MRSCGQTAQWEDMDIRHLPAATRALEGPEAEKLRQSAQEHRRRARESRERETSRRRAFLSNMSASELETAGVEDLEAAAACSCSCHPSPGDPAAHGGNRCLCQQSEQERREATGRWLEQLQQASQDLSAHHDAERRAVGEAAEELGVTLEQAGGAAPYQIIGSVDGVRFYLRERHDSWRLQIPDEEAGDDGDPVGFDTGVYVIAEGTSDSLYREGDPTWPLRLAVEEIRSHLRRRACEHLQARAFCPDCGARRSQAL